MIDLDDVESLAALDSVDALHNAETLSEQCERGYELGRKARDLPDPAGVDSIAVLGMGGSGFSGDAAQAVLEPRLPIHMRVMKGYPPLPEWVGRNSLVLAVSYSGNTEETLEAFAEARERGARIVTVSSGGAMREAAESFGIAQVTVPSGLLPRYAVGYLFMSFVGILETLGFAPNMSGDVREALKILGETQARCDRRVGTAQNPAKSLALSLVDRIPVIYGGDGLAPAAAYRFKCDLNENAKLPAFCGSVPEVDHNELEAWGHWSVEGRWPFLGVFIRDTEAHPRVAARFDAMREVLAGRLETVTVQARGNSRLARLLSLVGLTQMASIYLGLRLGRDPGPVEVLEGFKQRLARMQPQGRRDRSGGPHAR